MSAAYRSKDMHGNSSAILYEAPLPDNLGYTNTSSSIKSPLSLCPNIVPHSLFTKYLRSEGVSHNSVPSSIGQKNVKPKKTIPFLTNFHIA